MAQLNWLHLSDLHLGLRSSRLLRPEYREAFELDLRRLHERSGPWDVVVISGDLTSRGSELEFGVVTSTLDSLWNYFRSLGSDPCLLAVPGDMDFQWSLFPRAPSLNAPTVWKASPGVLEEVSRGLGAFSQWFASWQSSHRAPAAFQQGLLPGDFAATILKDDLKIGALGLNSVLKSAPGTRELRREQLSTAIGQELRQWAEQHDALLLLTHVAPIWLNSNALDPILTELVPPGRPFLHLCGGRRTNLGFRDTTISELMRPATRFYIQAPSLFSEVRGPEAWGYFAGQLPLSGTGDVRLFPRVASLSDGAVTLAPAGKHGSSEAFDLPLESLLWKPSAKSVPGDKGVQQVGASLPEARSAPTLRVMTEAASSAPAVTGLSLRTTLDTGEQKVTSMAWSPSGDALGAGLSDGHLFLWHPEEPRPRWVGLAHVSAIDSLHFSPDGQWLATRSFSRADPTHAG